ncbi:hypothetical protein [Vulcanisaeta distributa]|uniref:hypothetical protein n=1 Tax=Vulcanisaeta distributa TaxID=164451 RepID=UPI001FB482F5|nr:hypothetical protein [Vulcanisaeta distributa]
MRIEVIIQLIIALAFAISWFLSPLWYLKSNIYVQELTPLGFSITFLGHRYFLPLPNAITALTYAIASAVIPVIWRSSRYSLYLSLFTLSLAVMLIITVFVFQSRYLFYGATQYLVPRLATCTLGYSTTRTSGHHFTYWRYYML